jgi:hypothetical protein
LTNFLEIAWQGASNFDLLMRHLVIQEPADRGWQANGLPVDAG